MNLGKALNKDYQEPSLNYLGRSLVNQLQNPTFIITKNKKSGSFILIFFFKLFNYSKLNSQIIKSGTCTTNKLKHFDKVE